MKNVLTTAEQNLRLAAAYHRMGDEGRYVLDVVIQKLAEINGEPEKIKEIVKLTSFES